MVSRRVSRREACELLRISDSEFDAIVLAAQLKPTIVLDGEPQYDFQQLRAGKWKLPARRQKLEIQIAMAGAMAAFITAGIAIWFGASNRARDDKLESARLATTTHSAHALLRDSIRLGGYPPETQLEALLNELATYERVGSSSQEARGLRLSLLVQAGRIQEAEQALAMLDESRDESGALSLARGRLAVATGDYSAALPHLRAAMVGPFQVIAALTMAESYVKMNRDDDALQLLAAMVSSHPSDELLVERYAVHLLARDMPEQAIAACERFLAGTGTSSLVRTTLAIGHLAIGDAPSAIRQLALVPDRLDRLAAQFAIGVAKGEMGLAKEAVTELELAQTRWPGNVDITLSLAYTHLCSMHVSQAEAILARMPQATHSDLRVRIIRSLIEFNKSMGAASQQVIDLWHDLSSENRSRADRPCFGLLAWQVASIQWYRSMHAQPPEDSPAVARTLALMLKEELRLAPSISRLRMLFIELAGKSGDAELIGEAAKAIHDGLAWDPTSRDLCFAELVLVAECADRVPALATDAELAFATNAARTLLDEHALSGDFVSAARHYYCGLIFDTRGKALVASDGSDVGLYARAREEYERAIEALEAERVVELAHADINEQIAFFARANVGDLHGRLGDIDLAIRWLDESKLHLNPVLIQRGVEQVVDDRLRDLRILKAESR